MKPLVIYPAGNLLDLVRRDPNAHWRFSYVYAIEFRAGVVKVGKSKNPRARLKTIIRQAEQLGLRPTRFFVTAQFQNAHRVEQHTLGYLRREAIPLETPDDFPAASEWFYNADLEDVLIAARDWVPLPESPEIALLASDLAAKELAESVYAPTPVLPSTVVKS